MLAFRIAGVMPWRSASLPAEPSWTARLPLLYQWLVLLVVSTSVLVYLCELPGVRIGDTRDDVVSLMSDVPMAVGALLGLALLGCATGSKDLCDCHTMLISYVCRERFLEKWKRRSRLHLAAWLLVWVVAVVLRAWTCGVMGAIARGEFNVWGGIHMISFSACTFVLTAVAFYTQHLCFALAAVVDLYCLGAIARNDASVVTMVIEWNVLQAVMYKTSLTIEWTVFTMQGVAFSASVLGAMEAQTVFQGANKGALVPGFLIVCFITNALFQAAAVTDRCCAVPALINSLVIDLDIQRQYVVQYILHSDAGFHVLGVRVNTALALKIVYICGGVIAFVGWRI